MVSELEARSENVLQTNSAEFPCRRSHLNFCLELAEKLLEVTKILLQDCPRRVGVQVGTVWTW